MSNPESLQPPTHWHDMSERERRLFAKLEFIADGRVARTPLVAATILRNSWEWNMTILPRRRGEHYPVDFATLLAFSPSPYHPEAQSIEALRDVLEVTETAQRYRRELFQLGEPAFDQLAAYFEDPLRSQDADFPVLAAHTAHFLGSFSPSERPASLRHNRTAKHISGLAVASIGGAGGPDVACLLAEGLDWGYTGLEIAAWELAGAPRTSDATHGYTGQINAVRQLLKNRHGEATNLVWAYNELEPMRATIAEVAASGVPVIWIEAPESLVDWTAQNWDKDKGYLMATQRMVAEGLQDALEQGYALKLELPSLEIPPIPKDFDVLFDSYVEMAFDAFEWLHSNFGAPELSEARGELGRLATLRS